jgi:glutaredoxin 3
MTKQIEIYGHNGCAWCERARALATRFKQPFVYYNYTNDPAILAELLLRGNKAGVEVRTVPQIFIGDILLGGYEDFAKAIENGEIANFLSGEV